jgi:acyl-CoA thioester hydrolase
MQSSNEASDDAPAMNVSRVRVRMYHTDLVGGAFHGRYFDLFEEARTEAFRRAGFHWRMTHADGVAFVVTACGCDFFRPTAMDDELAIAFYVTRLSKARCTVVYEVRCVDQEPLLARGYTDFAFWDTGRSRLTAVPASVRDAVLRCIGMYRPDLDERKSGPARQGAAGSDPVAGVDERSTSARA